jgi:hypothetical protein
MVFKPTKGGFWVLRTKPLSYNRFLLPQTEFLSDSWLFLHMQNIIELFLSLDSLCPTPSSNLEAQ